MGTYGKQKEDKGVQWEPIKHNKKTEVSVGTHGKHKENTCFPWKPMGIIRKTHVLRGHRWKTIKNTGVHWEPMDNNMKTCFPWKPVENNRKKQVSVRTYGNNKKTLVFREKQWKNQKHRFPVEPMKFVLGKHTFSRGPMEKHRKTRVPWEYFRKH